jgi:hypothetical protein
MPNNGSKTGRHRVYRKRWGAASTAFFISAAKWMDISSKTGPDAVQATYIEMLNGRINPAKGHILSMHP